MINCLNCSNIDEGEFDEYYTGPAAYYCMIRVYIDKHKDFPFINKNINCKHFEPIRK